MSIRRTTWPSLISRLSRPVATPPLGFAYPWLLASLAATVCMTGLVLSESTVFLENRGYNLLHQLRHKLQPLTWDERLVIVAIDEASLARYGRFPWSRDRYAQLLDRLWTTQPAVVSFDILMPETTAQDGQFAQAIADSGNIVLAIGYDNQGNPLQIPASLAEPAEGSLSVGYVNHLSDADGVSRKISFHKDGVPALSVETLNTYLISLAHTTQQVNRTSFRRAPLELSKIDEPRKMPQQNSLDEMAWLNWPSPAPEASSMSRQPSLTVLSFADVVEGNIDLSQLQNKIVLVGATALGMDPLRTPFHLDSPTHGVYLHAAILDNLLNQRFLQRLPQYSVPLVIAILSGLTGYLLYDRGVKAHILCYVGFPLLWFSLVYSAFLMQIWLPLVAPVGAVWLTAVGIQLQNQLHKQQLMNLFSMSVSPETAKMIWQRKQEIFQRGELAPQELTATVLFMDIRGFTSISEKLSSKVLLDWLNEYFEAMTDCIMAHGGVVDKYIGDAIMAVFGAPFPRTQPEQIQQDAIAAIQASQQMHQKLAELNQHFLAHDLPTVTFGIGIHTGKLVAGTVGNQHRMSYSIFGDTVNVAARIESMTKDLPTSQRFRILISGATQEQIKNHCETAMFCSTALRGRDTETTVYSLPDSRYKNRYESSELEFPV